MTQVDIVNNLCSAYVQHLKVASHFSLFLVVQRIDPKASHTLGNSLPTEGVCFKTPLSKDYLESALHSEGYNDKSRSDYRIVSVTKLIPR